MTEIWKNIDGNYNIDDRKRYTNGGPLIDDFTRGEYECYQECKNQPETNKKDRTFKSVVSLNNKCYCSFRGLDKLEKAQEKNTPSIVELNIKRMEVDMLMRDYKRLFAKYLKEVNVGNKKSDVIQYNKNVKEFNEQDFLVRYVRIQHKNQYLHVQEIEVFDENGNNVAYHQPKPTVHWYQDCNQCGVNICDSRNYDNMSSNDIAASFNGYQQWGGNLNAINNNKKRYGGPGIVSEVGCCNIDTAQKAIRDTTTGGIFGISNIQKKDEENPNKTTAKASSEGWKGRVDYVIDGNKHSNDMWPNSNHTDARGWEDVELDLKKDVDVKKVKIYNRPDGAKYRLKGAVVLLYNSKRELLNKPYTLSSGRIQTYNVDLRKQPKKGFLYKLFLNNVSRKQCFDDCADDDNCKYVLWGRRPYKIQTSRGTRSGWRSRCLQYDETAEGLIDIDSDSKDRNSFAYNAWEKETWNDMPSKDITGSAQWNVDLGTSKSLKACKNAAVQSDDGPFSAIVFTNEDYSEPDKRNKCYGIGMETPKDIKDKEGVISSVPPGGETGKLESGEAVGILKELVDLNEKITTHMSNFATGVGEAGESGKKNKPKLKSMQNIYNKAAANDMVERLNNDRNRLIKLTKEISDTDASIKNLEFLNLSDRMKMYLLMIICIILVTVVTLYFKGSLPINIVYGVVGVSIIIMYVYNWRKYNEFFLTPVGTLFHFFDNIKGQLISAGQFPTVDN